MVKANNKQKSHCLRKYMYVPLPRREGWNRRNVIMTNPGEAQDSIETGSQETELSYHHLCIYLLCGIAF